MARACCQDLLGQRWSPGGVPGVAEVNERASLGRDGRPASERLRACRWARGGPSTWPSDAWQGRGRPRRSLAVAGAKLVVQDHGRWQNARACWAGRRAGAWREPDIIQSVGLPEPGHRRPGTGRGPARRAERVAELLVVGDIAQGLGRRGPRQLRVPMPAWHRSRHWVRWARAWSQPPQPGRRSVQAAGEQRADRNASQAGRGPERRALQ